MTEPEELPDQDLPADSAEEPAGDRAGLSILGLNSLAGDETALPDRTRIPEQLPILAVRDSVAFPGTVMPINVGREKSKRVLDLALTGDHLIGVFAQRLAAVEDPKLDDLYRIGTACRILKMLKLPDGSETIIVHGIARLGIETITQESPYLEAQVHAQFDEEMSTPELEALTHNVRHAAEQILELSPNVPEEARIVLDHIRSKGGLADFLAANLSLPLVYRQELLETFDVGLRLRKVHAAIASQLEVLELRQKLDKQVRDEIDKSQREYYLRQQLKAIQAELGQADARTSEIEALRKKVTDAKMPPAAEAAAKREIDRLATIPQASAEYSVALDYVEWLASLPWSVRTTDNLDLVRAEQVLNEDHYGLDKIKRRIIEFLAVRTLKPDGKGSILCFVGPPGVGKTSLGRSIARALERRFIRMSLGGVRDEAEIRGHRRTYVGAMPGRIIQEIRKCGSGNPVFMLDEVDKLGQDFRGDPSAALLEVLDPQQNDTFTDHYLDVAFDLSGTLFIATANYLDAVPPPLRDRMETIVLSSYTQGEKFEIAKRYLVPRQISENGLTADQISFTDDALRLIIHSYTRESGVRELERQIGAIARAEAARIVRRENQSLSVTAETVRSVLGPVRFEPEVAAREVVPGVATGLAFTPVGGEILFIEVSRMPGQGRLTLTGQIGDVMRESAQAAYTIVRSRAKSWRIRPDDFARYDLHVHVPAGAVPKDGPSAGSAMLAALVSIVKGCPVDPLTAMTGEITLRGLVLPVGGIKEKVLAAHRAGIKRVVMPRLNLKDLEEVPADVRQQLSFVPVSTIDQVIAEVFTAPVARPAGRGSTRTPRPPRPVVTARKRRETRPSPRVAARASRSRPRPAAVVSRSRRAGRSP